MAGEVAKHVAEQKRVLTWLVEELKSLLEKLVNNLMFYSIENVWFGVVGC